MIAGDTATVAELNARAQAGRVAAGEVTETGLPVADGRTAGVGDLVLTRENHRLLATGRRWVKNGERWMVTATHADGSMIVRRADGAGEVVLPADYVAAHVELAYATTAHRAQGRTVDTSHAYITPTTTREVLYVAATRGRGGNHLYVDTGWDPDPATSHDEAVTAPTVDQILAGVLARDGGDLSAHETRRRAAEHAASFAGLAAEYQTFATEAQQHRWDRLLDRCPLSPEQLEAVRASDAYGPLLAALRDAESRGLDVKRVLPHLAAKRTLADADDPAAVLHHRVDTWANQATPKSRGDELIAGLIPRAIKVSDPDLARALAERDRAMQQRARRLAAEAVARHQPWGRHLGPPPAEPARRDTWMTAVATAAAYRDRWALDEDPRPLGPDRPTSVEQLDQRRRALTALTRARRLAADPAPSPEPVLAADHATAKVDL